MFVKNHMWHTFGCWNAEWYKIQYSPLTHTQFLLHFIYTQHSPDYPREKWQKKWIPHRRIWLSRVVVIPLSTSLNIHLDSALKCSCNLHSSGFCSCTSRRDGGFHAGVVLSEANPGCSIVPLYTTHMCLFSTGSVPCGYLQRNLVMNMHTCSSRKTVEILPLNIKHYGITRFCCWTLCLSTDYHLHGL